MTIWTSMMFSLCIACTDIKKSQETEVEAAPQFTVLKAEQTGLNFSNNLTSSAEFNVFHYMYFYNGGGVAVADFNQDGKTDIFFTANMESNGLYLNQGNLLFKDVTEQAGLKGMEGWTSGACAVDVNQDGLMDIYVSQLGDFRSIKGRNQLYICEEIGQDGVPQFVDKAAEYGLDLIGFGTQATFFDFDRDGDLDMYQLNHSVHNNGTFGQRKTFIGTTHPLAGDRLMRNDNGKYVDVSMGSGIHSTAIGYGLGVATGDINLDGWPDLYVCNDFHENDYLYLNQQNGTFREVLTEQMPHTSRYSMGVDIADINNDGYSEIFSLDMHPYDPHILKSSLGEDGYGIFQFKIGYGYNHQYARNNLQLNNHNGTFSDIAVFAGVHNTDWSWAALFLDFDHDGFKDLFVSNGIPKRMNDIDYINHVSNQEVKWKISMDEMEETDLALEEKLPEIRIPNKLFRNNGKLQFEELTNIFNDTPSFSNGTAYADFDNDGDLDVVVNNIGDSPFLYQNLMRENNTTNHAYLHLKLKGTSKNQQAIGAKVVAYQGLARLVKEQFPVAGYQSSVEYGIHLGLGDLNRIDSIHLIWPDGTYQSIDKALCNQQKEIVWTKGLPVYSMKHSVMIDTPRIEITDVTSETQLNYQHRENPFVEFDREPLIPHMTSAEGPAIAVGDVSGDGREDIFIGAAKLGKNALFIQQADGTFLQSRQVELEQDSVHEDVDALILDIDGDGDNDLIVASGGNEFRNQAEALTQRLYRNEGTGIFTRDATAFKDLYLTAACVAPMDFDGDGDIDLFFGGRAEPWSYGTIPRSYVLENNGGGIFKDVTERVCEDLMFPGLVRDAEWADVDGDKQIDLIVAVEWGALQIFMNSDGQLRKRELKGTNGIWNFITPADIDSDGDIDFVAGNLGLNSELKASQEKPVRLYLSDVDQNGRTDQLLTYYLGDREVLYPTFAEITQQIPVIKKKYLFARVFADASIEDLMGAENYRNAERLELYLLENAWFENKGDGQFNMHSLPRNLQFAPLRAGLIRDFDGDNTMDMMLLGNFYEANIEMGRYDADYGNILFGGNAPEEGFVQQMNVTGQVRNIREVIVGDKQLTVIARNNAPLIVLQLGRPQPDL